MELLIPAGILVIAAVAAVIVWASRAAGRRTDALREVAARMGWGFREHVPYDAIPNLDRFELFATGRQRKLRNLLTSPPGEVRGVVFDYSFVTGSGKSQQTHRQTVFYLASERLDLPTFSLRPEHFFHKVAALLGYQDIDLDGRPEFSRLFLLRGENEARVRAAFNDAVAGFFERHTGTCAAGKGGELLYWRPRGTAKPEDVTNLIAQGRELADIFVRMPSSQL